MYRIDGIAAVRKGTMKLLIELPDDASEVLVTFWSMENLPKPFVMKKYQRARPDAVAYLYEVKMEVSNAVSKD